MEIVVVRWYDAHTTESTQYAVSDVPHSPLVVETLGWLLRDDDIGVSVANEKVGPDQFRGYTFVPRGMVKDVKPVVKKRRKNVKPVAQPVPPLQPVQ